MFPAKYTGLVFAIIVWSFILVFIKPHRAKQLLPVAMLSAIILFTAEYFLITLNLFKFNNPLLPIGGIPLFHLVWGAGSGIILIHFMKRELIKKVVLIIFFTIATLLFETISLAIGASSQLNNFTSFHSAIVDILMLITLTGISESLWAERIYSFSPKST